MVKKFQTTLGGFKQKVKNLRQYDVNAKRLVQELRGLKTSLELPKPAPEKSRKLMPGVTRAGFSRNA
jgi:hypothetical protein